MGNIYYCIEGNVVDRASAKNGKGWCEDVSPTLNTQDHHAICFQLCGDRDNPSVSVSDNAYCIPANPMSDRGQAVCIALEGNGARPSHLGKGFSDDGTMYTLNTIEQHSVCYGISRSLLKGGMNGGGIPLGCNIQPAMTANGTGAVCYAIESHPMDSRVTMTDEGVVQTLNARMGTGGGNVPLVLIEESMNEYGQ